MTIEEIHEKTMSNVRGLRNLNRYKEANEMMRRSNCAHLRLSNLEGVEEQGIDSFYNIGDVLLSSAEHFGDRKDKQESYEAWNERTKEGLQELYKCELTGAYCISRTNSFHHSDIPEGACNQVIANVDIQIRCPAFEFKDGLIEKLEEENEKH